MGALKFFFAVLMEGEGVLRFFFAVSVALGITSALCSQLWEETMFSEYS